MDEPVLELQDDAAVVVQAEDESSDTPTLKFDEEEGSDDGDDDDDPPPAGDVGDKEVTITKTVRRKKSPSVLLSEADERLVATWLETDGHFIYDKGNRSYKDRAKCHKAFQDLGKKMDPPKTAEELRTWWYSVRSRFGRLTTSKSGQGASQSSKRLTDRERWILDVFHFLKPHIVRQRKPSMLGLKQVRIQSCLSILVLLCPCKATFKYLLLST